MSEEENRLESGRLIGTGAVNSRLNEVKRHLSREPPALQESLERDSNFCPVFSLYEHNFDRRFFDCDVPAIDGRFIGFCVFCRIYAEHCRFERFGGFKRAVF